MKHLTICSVCAFLTLLIVARVHRASAEIVSTSIATQQEITFADILLAIIKHESRGNPNAMYYEKELHKDYPHWSKEDATAYGLGQVVYGWHKKEHKLKSPKELLDPKRNIEIAAKYLAYCGKVKKYNIPQTIGCYNAGPKQPPSKEYVMKVLEQLRK